MPKEGFERTPSSPALPPPAYAYRPTPLIHNRLLDSAAMSIYPRPPHTYTSDHREASPLCQSYFLRNGKFTPHVLTCAQIYHCA